MQTLLQDTRYAWRGVRKSPVFASAAILTFGLGIGANAAIFSLMNRMFIQAPPGAAHWREISTLFQDRVDRRILSVPTRSVFSYRELRDIKTSINGASGITFAAYTAPLVPTQSPNDLHAVEPTYVVGDYFGVLGVRAELGRLFADDETLVESVEPVAVISHQLWTDHFGKDQTVLNRPIHVDGQEYRIIGVAGDGFRGIDLVPVDLWLPLGSLTTNRRFNPSTVASATSQPTPSPRPAAPWYESRLLLHIVVRSSATMRNSLAPRFTAALRSTTPGDTTSRASLVSVLAGFRQAAGGNVIRITTRVAGVTAILLIIACGNVTLLLLARVLSRRREIGVRAALGASTWRLIAQTVTGNLVLGLCGGGAALAIGSLAAAGLRDALLPHLEWHTTLFGAHGLQFVLATALVAGIGASIVPALIISRLDLMSTLHGGIGAGRQRSFSRDILIAVQSGLSIVLLAGAGLFVRSLHNVNAVDIGYDADQLVLAHVPYDTDTPITALGAQMPDLAARIERLPGVERVSLIANPMMTGFPKGPVYLSPPDPSFASDEIQLSIVPPQYFATVGVRLLEGRLFSDDDRLGSEPVTIVSQFFAKSAWPNERAIGKCVMIFDKTEPCRSVVGIVSDVHAKRIIEERSMRVYVPIAQAGTFAGSAMVIRTQRDRAADVATEVRRMFGEMFGGDGGRLVQTMSSGLSAELRPWRTAATLFSAAGLCAMLIAMVGVYSAVAYDVSQRTREIGVRAALGATPRAVLRLVLIQGIKAVAWGIFVGLGATLALGRLVESMLYDVRPYDPLVLATVSLLILLGALAACLIPALRATRVHPTVALQAE